VSQLSVVGWYAPPGESLALKSPPACTGERPNASPEYWYAVQPASDSKPSVASVS
jgi:hypothetical protein